MVPQLGTLNDFPFDDVAHLFGRDNLVGRGIGRGDIERAPAIREGGFDGVFNRGGFGREAKGVTQKKCRGQDCGEGVCAMGASDIGRGTVDRLVKAVGIGAERRGRRHAD
jgi:hypothetical protein